ncbi:uncharacterized protein BXIN_1814 [Babesia sp. Xinjiang]|uniref:uncharacterized protein n=1 Tax=Babesia sp. Xinjiang TaxID=462227 RepID=UPI000A21D163|nr:uncharacterized protein BXIN_1814 [Babesia sp. Xinjiang]ORM39603.1 hypothetical protein BXIN_1814 [Babesia sp. Xinjiang]
MGFNKDCLSQSHRTGNYIYWILHYFTQDDRNSVSLCNIFICLMCCSLRTPRTVGDLFGFFFSIGENMNNGGSSSPKVAEAIKKSAENIPWNSDGSCSMTDALKTLAGSKSDHNGTSHPADATLYTLHYSKCTTPQTCGSYLDPLASNIYPIISASFAMSNLSRIVYLAEVLYDGLKQLQKDFQKLKCKHHNKQSCSDGCHESNSCQCSVVECSEVLGLLYSYGLHYYYPGELHSDDDKKRTCKQFATQLQAVINNLFEPLLSAINLFLHSIRQPFLLYLLTFWLVAIMYFTYSLTIPLDLFHIRSHLRPALSHQISVLALLSHRAMSPTKVGYFTP